MKLLEQIKKDAMVAFKAGEKEKKLILSTLVGEIQLNKPEINDGVKTWSDEIAIKTIKKMIQSNTECGLENENEIISVYMPEMKTQEELEMIISGIISLNKYEGMKDMGKVMSVLSTTYAGQYDGKMASTIVRSKL